MVVSEHNDVSIVRKISKTSSALLLLSHTLPPCFSLFISIVFCYEVKTIKKIEGGKCM